MILYLIFFSKSIPNECIPGINYWNWCRHTDCPPSGKGFTEIIQNSSTNGVSNRQDFGFFGTFCPNKNGLYRIILEGIFNPNCEYLYNSRYSLYNFSSNSRISSYIYLNNKACYSFSTYTSTCILNSYGSLYIQFENNTKYLLTFKDSYSCELSFCKKDNLKFPECIEISNNYKFNINLFSIIIFIRISSFIFIIFFI